MRGLELYLSALVYASMHLFVCVWTWMCATVWVCISVSLCMQKSGVIYPWDYICICVWYVYAWVCLCGNVSLWVFVSIVWRYSSVRLYLHLCINVCVCVCVCEHACVQLSECVSLWVCVCMELESSIHLSDWAHLVWKPSLNRGVSNVIIPWCCRYIIEPQNTRQNSAR